MSSFEVSRAPTSSRGGQLSVGELLVWSIFQKIGGVAKGSRTTVCSGRLPPLIREHGKRTPNKTYVNLVEYATYVFDIISSSHLFSLGTSASQNV